jgi:hypothetical protein
MDKKELLVRLCRELTERVEYLYKECKGALLDVGGIAQWVSREYEEELLWSIQRGHRALENSRLKELSWEIRRIVEEIMQDKEEGKENREGQL